ncbi:hypothetical protein [Arthrobacter sp. Z4-13]
MVQLALAAVFAEVYESVVQADGVAGWTSAWALGAAWLTLVVTAHRLYLTTRVHPA